jgi:acyl-CoA thioesterase FadM
VARFNSVFRSRGYDLDAERLVPAHVLLRYMEHLRWEYAARGASEVVALFREGHAFMVVAQTLRIARDIGVDVPISGTLWIGHSGRTSFTYLHTLHHSDEGGLIAAGSTTAVYLGLRGIPSPLPDCLRQTDSDPPMMPDLKPPDSGDIRPAVFENSYRVRASDLDFLQHMNQANYAALYDDTRQAAADRNAYGPGSLGAGRIRLLRVEYLRSALPGERLDVATWPAGSDPLTLGFAMRRKNILISRAVVQL